MVRFDNFHVQYSHIKEEIDNAVHRVLDSGWFILGKELETFEKEFASYIGSKYSVGVASGTDAITLSLMAMGIGKGDDVITSDMTAFPTIAAIINSGATPVVTDISPEDGLMDPAQIEKHITSKTKAIIPVHLYGQSCDLDAIGEIARKYGIRILEDCAQSVGARYKTKRTGTIGEVNAFSFYPTKNLGAYGDGGAITTDSDDIYQKLLQLRNYGQSVRYYHDHFGINSRLDEIQAAILNVKLKYLDEWNLKRLEHARFYRENLHSSPVRCLNENSYGTPVYHLFIVKTPQRNRLMDHLKSNGIQSLIHYPVPMHRQKAFPISHSGTPPNDSDFENTTAFADQILSIPIYPELNREDQEKIIQTIRSF